MKYFLFLILFSNLALADDTKKISNTEKTTVDSKAYNYTRRLESYSTSLEDNFLSYLRTLKKGDVWLDSGAGDALALVDYLQSGGVATVVALDARKTENAETLKALNQFPSQFRYLQGRYTESYSPRELFPLKLITDLCGAIAYSSHLDGVLKVLLGSLSQGGRLYFEMDDSTHASYVNESDRLQILKVIEGKQTKIPAAQYFSAIKGVKFQQGRASYGGEGIGTYFIRTPGKLEVPLLSIKDYEAGAPPKKTYVWQ